MTYHTKTTLAEIRALRPYAEGWFGKLLSGLSKTVADDEPLDIATVLEIIGFDDALLCLRVPSLEKLSRHFQAAVAERVLHLFEAEHPGDTRVRDQIAMLRNDDDATPEQREKARDAARAAVWDAAGAKRDAPFSAAFAAAQNDAWGAWFNAARAAAWTGAWPAPRLERAARAAAERTAQEKLFRKMIGAAS